MIDDVIRDPRVSEINRYNYVVEGAEDRLDVSTSEREPGIWLVCPSLASPSMRRANLRSREDAEEWVEQHTTEHDSLREALFYALTRVGGAR